MRRDDKAEVGKAPALLLQRALQQESGAAAIIELHALFAAICFSISLIVRGESLPPLRLFTPRCYRPQISAHAQHNARSHPGSDLSFF